MCIELDTKLSCLNLSSLLSSNAIEKHDIADDCANWQKGVKSFKDHAHKYDLESVFLVPLQFDRGNPVGPFVNLLDNFQNISDTQVYEWQLYLNERASSVDIESLEWAQEVLVKTMDDALETAVDDALESVAFMHRGAITTFKLMVNKMVLMNQESIDALHEYLRNFDIRNVDGENVAIASSRLRAVIRALDTEGLPANVVNSLLKGFSHASNAQFTELCVTLRSLHSSSMHKTMIGAMNKKAQCFLILKDLEVNFNDQTAGKKWNFTHDGAAFRASYNTYLQVNAAEGRVPYKEWIETCTCNNCGEIRHLLQNCTKPQRERQFC